MKTSSAKQKGRVLQKKVRDDILKTFPELTDRDVSSTPMGVAGEDIKLSEKAFKMLGLVIETKNQEKLNIWSALEQAKGENREGIPLLIFKRNRSDIYCSLKWEDFLNMIKSLNDLKEELTT